ncbi:hypothetical protein CHR53_18850 [Neobacillus mesonae]|uniref:Uncharacterized protein n=1 Tax=Neobacillus mesonae TaxID=1193713 RepID=A0A3Q9QWT9_9BACI|nr:hypothetical protein CHR53_18850 [Neobacillus mesonae]
MTLQDLSEDGNFKFIALTRFNDNQWKKRPLIEVSLYCKKIETMLLFSWIVVGKQSYTYLIFRSGINGKNIFNGKT